MSDGESKYRASAGIATSPDDSTAGAMLASKACDRAAADRREGGRGLARCPGQRRPPSHADRPDIECEGRAEQPAVDTGADGRGTGAERRADGPRTLEVQASSRHDLAMSLPARASIRYRVDPANPRAPSREIWETLSPEEQRRVDAALPCEFPLEQFMPEGDGHNEPVKELQDALRRWFSGPNGRSVYVGSDLPVYYPDEDMFAPDIFVTLDVSGHWRDRWNVLAEGRGLDVALEATYHGDRTKDSKTNVLRYARLGIPEYFVADLVRGTLIGYRLAAGTSTYTRILPRAGRVGSLVLGLEFCLEEQHLRAYSNDAPVPTSVEASKRLETALNGLNAKLEAETERAEAEAARAEAEAGRAAAEAERAAAAEARVEALLTRLRAAGIEPMGG